LKLHHLLEFFILCCFRKKNQDNTIRTKLRKSLHRLSPFTVGDGPCTSPHPRIVAVASALIRAAATSGVYSKKIIPFAIPVYTLETMPYKKV
jgi:hypothetical protein